MGVHSQPEKMEEVMEVHLPVELCVYRQRQYHARYLPSYIIFQESFILGVCCVSRSLQMSKKTLDNLRRHRISGPALLVVLALEVDFLPRRLVELFLHDRITRALFIHAGRSMAQPLPYHENRGFDME